MTLEFSLSVHLFHCFHNAFLFENPILYVQNLVSEIDYICRLCEFPYTFETISTNVSFVGVSLGSLIIGRVG